MSQDPLSTATGSGLAVRTGINAAIARLASGASGVSRPADIATFELWIETDNPGGGIASVWRYDGTTDVLIGLLNTTTHAFTSAGAIASSSLDTLLGSTKGMIAKRSASAWAGMALGSALYHLRMNAAADDVEYFQAPAVISDQVLAAVSSVSFQNIPTGYKNLELHFELLPGTNSVSMQATVFVANVEDTGANYSWVNHNGNSAGGAGSAGAGAQTSGYLGTIVKSDASNGGISGVLRIPNYQATRYTKMFAQMGWIDSTNGYHNTLTAFSTHNVAAAIDGLKIKPSAGTFSGRATLVGW